jgi:hypothetical protein
VEALGFPWFGVECVVKCKRDKKHEGVSGTIVFSRPSSLCRVPGSDQQIVIGISVREQHQLRLMHSRKSRNSQRGEAPDILYLLLITLDILLACPVHGARLQSLVAFMVNFEVRLESVSGQQRELHPGSNHGRTSPVPCPAAWMRILPVNQ